MTILLFSLIGARAEPLRVALVIGNGAYRIVPALQNPPNDARSVAAILSKLGFQTELLLDGSQAEMLASIRRLRDRSAGSEATVLYYAGHATEIDGSNYLLPIDISAERAAIQRSSVDFRSVMDSLHETTSTTLIVLDACRDNPFSATAARHRWCVPEPDHPSLGNQFGIGLPRWSSRPKSERF